MTRGRTIRLAGLSGLVIAALGLGTWATGALGAGGDLTYIGCIALNGANGCVDPPEDSLDQAFDAAVSPDGSSVYTASNGSSAVTAFTRATDGSIAFQDCIRNGGAGGCVAPTLNSLGNASDVAVSPDGNSVYVASILGESVTSFTRAADGTIAFQGCIANGGANGCVDPPKDSLDLASGVDVSADGNSVYVASNTANSVTSFTRAANGSLAFQDCVANGGAFTCVDPAKDSLSGARAVEVSPDGNSVYVGGSFSVTHLTRAANGSLAFQECYSSGGSNGCAVGSGGSTFIQGLDASADGRNLYMTALGSDAVSSFIRAADGSLTFQQCISNSGQAGCTDLAQDTLDEAVGVAASADGQSVYVGAQQSNAVSNFLRAADGSLSFANCVANGGQNGCADPPLDSLGTARGVATSPDATSLYVASQGTTDSISHLSRELFPLPQPVPPPTCAGEDATIVGTSGPDQLSGTKKKDVVAALGGNDEVKSRSGNDIVCGGSGKDRLAGAKGKDRVDGENGADRLAGGKGRDRLSGAKGPDKLFGGKARDRLSGGKGRDLCVGGTGRDRASSCEKRRSI